MLVEYLTGGEPGRTVGRRLEGMDFQAHLPHLAAVELASALRGLVRAGKLTASRAAAALQDFQELPLCRHPHEPLLARVWELRENVTAYDAVYLALAEALDATLLTCDARLARAPVSDARIELVS